MPDGKAPVRTLLVDDHPLFRQGLRQVMGGRDTDVIGEASDCATALQMFTDLQPELVVLDIGLPDGSGLDLARQMLKQTRNLRVVILTMLSDEDILHTALDAGVLGYVLKECAADEIVDCVRAVLQGTPFVSAQMSAALVRRRGQDGAKAGRPGLDRLTTAERRILKLLAQTRTTKEIALALDVSPRTVEAHRANIGSKLGLKGSHSLLRFAIANSELLDNLD
jgi:DNA-binding NarL/FixJ family response regulator